MPSCPLPLITLDRSLEVTHDHDTQSEHGSHVAGIAAANAYIPVEMAPTSRLWTRF